MKALWGFSVRFLALVLASGYLLLPSALIYAASPPPTCFITVNPTSISVGGSVTVKWQSTNATAGAITNIGNVGPSGQINLLPSSAGATYFGSFTGPGGTTNCQASVSVNSSGSGGSTDTTQTNPVNVGTAISVTNQTPVAAQGSGLVPCGYNGYNGNGVDQGASTGCQACNLAQLIQNVITFLIGIAIPIAAALFAYAGWLYFTSAASPSNKDKAKKIFGNAFMGFALAISAWLIVNTFLHVIFSQGAFSSGNWFVIQCDTANRTVNGNIGTLLSQIPILNGGTAVTGSGNISTNGSPGSTGSSGGGGGGTSGIGTDSYTDTLQTLTDLCSTNGDDASCNAANDYQNNHQMTTAVQDVLDDACGDDSAAACKAAMPITSNGTMGAPESSIANAAIAYKGTDTSAGPDGGNKACAWAVNNVLQSDGIAPIDGNSVAGMQQQLDSGRGTPVNTADAQAGDIIIWKSDTVSHVGICQDAGCTTALSNSSSNASFTNVSGSTLMGVPGKVYKVNQ